MERIFICIASNRDHGLDLTIQDCLRKARLPERLLFGIHWIHDNHEFFEQTFDPRFKVIDTHYKNAKGPAWALRKARGLYAGQAYVLQIASSMRFAADWDVICIDGIRQLQANGHSKVVITRPSAGTGPGADTGLDGAAIGLQALPPQRPQSEALRFRPGRSIAADFVFSTGELLACLDRDSALSNEDGDAYGRCCAGYAVFYADPPLVFPRPDDNDTLAPPIGRPVDNLPNRSPATSADTIFVQIAAYRDPQLIPTIIDMIANARHPQRLHLAVCWQHGDDEPLSVFTTGGLVVEKTASDARVHGLPVVHLAYAGTRLSIVDVDYRRSRGACWARNTLQQLYEGETYTLQLDSHHRFTRHWDQTLIDMLESVRDANTPKPVLTTYAPAFDPQNDPAARGRDPWKMDFDRFIPEGAVFFIPSRIDHWEQLTRPVPARFYSAHFAFADGTFAVDVQHDPEYFFHGEEISITVRAFTHGYDLFHPHRVVLWHEYSRKGRKKVWTDHTADTKRKGHVEEDWTERNRRCHQRNRILFGMDGEDPKSIDFGKYGFGTARTLRQYEEYAGIGFASRGVHQLTLNRSPHYHYPPNNLDYASEEEWKKTLIRSNDIRICIHRNELRIADHFGEGQPDFDFFYMGAHDEGGGEIFRKDLHGKDLAKHLQKEWLDCRLVFADNRKPASYTVWPHSAAKGWLTKIEKRIDQSV